MSYADRKALLEAAEAVSDAAKTISATRSRRIPASTHVDPGGTDNNVSVITEGATAPNAAPFVGAELHPLWAKVGSYRYIHFKWGKQPYWPYMWMAAAASLDDAAILYANSVYDYAFTVGFK